MYVEVYVLFSLPGEPVVARGLNLLQILSIACIMAASTELSVEDVSKALESLTTEQTKDLVVHFGVKLYIASDIEVQYKDRCPKLHLLEAWLNADTDASWEKIVVRLRQTGMNVLAQRLTTQYCSLLSTAASSADTTKSDTGPAADHSQPLAVTPGNVRMVKAKILHLQKTFSKLVSGTRSVMCHQEKQDPTFLENFCDELLTMPVAQKCEHVKFFRDIENEILDAKNVRKIFAILCRYWNYRNYDILENIILWYDNDSLQTKMQEFYRMLEEFEKATPVDVYVIAEPANESVKAEFSKMVAKLEKSSSECTLYDLRKLKEEIAGGASLKRYSVYIESESVHCVVVSLSFPRSAVGWVMAGMTSKLMSTHRLTEVAVDGKYLSSKENAKQTGLLVCVYLKDMLKEVHVSE